MTVSEAKEFLKNMHCSCPTGAGPMDCKNEECKLYQAVTILTQPKATSELKAWKVIDKWYDCGTNIVFAETRAKATYLALNSCDEYMDCNWTDMRVTRFPEYDKYYEGKFIVDWEDPKQRIILVKEFGWHCWPEMYPDQECETCPAKEWCDLWQEYQEDLKSEKQDGIQTN